MTDQQLKQEIRQGVTEAVQVLKEVMPEGTSMVVVVPVVIISGQVRIERDLEMSREQ